MYYSLTFIVNGVQKNTWDDWQMIPNTPPMIPPPEPNLDLVDIPGRSHGPLDMTGAAFNKVTFKRVTGTWSFYKEAEDGDTRRLFYDYIQNFFNAKVGKVILQDEDPLHYYAGRFKVSIPTTNKGPMTFQISYDLIPARWNVSDNKSDPTYGSEDVTIYDDESGQHHTTDVRVEWDEAEQEVRVIYT